MSIKLSKFDIICQKHGLTDYLKTLTIEELNKLLNMIMADDIIGTREKIYETIKIELQYRESEKELEARKIR